jgi:transposase
MKDPKRFVGLDVHKAKTVACILDVHGEVVRRVTVQTTQDGLTAFGKSILRKTDHVVLETTTNSHAVVRILKPFVESIVIANSRHVRLIADSSIKTDAIDAEALARLLRLGNLPTVWIPDEPTRLLRRLSNRRASLVGDRTAMKNRLQSELAQELIVRPDGDLFGKAGLEWLRTTMFPRTAREFVDSELRLLERVNAELAILEKELATRVYDNPSIKLLMTIPGVSLASGIGLLAAIGDVSRFPSADKMASYIGLVPKTRQSADKCYHGPITKEGNANVRWLMIQAAQHNVNHPGPLGVTYRRLAKKKCHNVAVVALARKMVCTAWHMLTKNEPYHYAVPRSTETKLAKLRVLATGKRRTTGPKKGTRPSAPQGATRGIPSYEELCEKEGLPKPIDIDALPEGEKKVLRGTKIMGEMRELRQAKRIPRRSSAKSDAAVETSTESL